MIEERFEIGSLKDESADLIARLVPSERAFGWRRRSLLVPAGWMLLATRDRRDPLLVLAGGQYEHEDTRDLLFVRDAPTSCSVDAADLRSADGHPCRGRLEIAVRVPADAAELAAFRRTIVHSSNVVRRADLLRYVQADLRRVLVELAAERTAA
ncbi:MAG: hypothetical protein HY718_08710, partial [Planctomycetes bacterium]|nr:hypothetical protein [Planctomycetota bacterium]